MRNLLAIVVAAGSVFLGSAGVYAAPAVPAQTSGSQPMLVLTGGHGGHEGGHGGGFGGMHGGHGFAHGGFAPQVRPMPHAPVMSAPRPGMLGMNSHRQSSGRRHSRYYPSTFFWPTPDYRYRANTSWDYCADLKRKAYATGKRYWLKRYEACRAHG